MRNALEWLDGSVPVARWLVIVLAITMLFEMAILVHDLFKK